MKPSRLALAIAVLPSLALAAGETAPDEAVELHPLVITRGTPIQRPAPASIAVIDRRLEEFARRLIDQVLVDA